MLKKAAKRRQAPRFSTEEALVRAFLKYADESPVAARLVGREFETTNGIADIVQFRLSKSWRKRSNLGGISAQWTFALHSLPYRRIFKTVDFEELCRTSKATAAKVLRQYVKEGFCIRTKSGGWSKIRQPRPVVREIATIEAKLSNWQRALSQAYRHQTFAAQTWVLLDAARADAALKNIDKFRRLNVGLIVLSRDGPPRKKFAPLKKRPKSQLHFWNANSALARRLRLKVGGVVTVNNV